MKSFSIAVLFALFTTSSEAFFVSSSSGRCSFVGSTTACKKQALFVSTELTAESVGKSSDDEESANDNVDVPTGNIIATDVSAAAETAAPSAEPQEKPAVKSTPEEAVRHTIFLGNLPFGTHLSNSTKESDEDSVRAMLSEFGEVVLVSVPKNRETGKPRGFAFVDMGTAEQMEAAIAGADGLLLDGRVLRASQSLPKEKQPKKPPSKNNIMGKLYVGNIAYTTTEEMLVDHFGAYGTVFEVFLPKNQNGDPRGYAFVTLKNEELESVIESADGQELDGRVLSVTKPLPPGQKSSRRQVKQNRTKIYVGNLSFYTTQDTLEEVFSEFGNIYDCYIPTDAATGSSKGFGFITMDPEDAQRAIVELDSCELDGRIIRVNEAQPKGRKPKKDNMNSDEDSVDIY